MALLLVGGRTALIPRRADATIPQEPLYGHIVFQSGSAELSDVRVMNLIGGDVHTVSPPGGPFFAPSLSPDGTKILLDDVGAQHLVVANADGSQPHTVFSETTVGVVNDPTWSPDGSQIAFVHRHGQSLSTDPADIDVMNADGSGLHTVATALVGPAVGGLVWSPDGTELAFVPTSGGIERVPASGGTPQTVLVAGAGGFLSTGQGTIQLSWSPGASILFSEITTAGSSVEMVKPDGTGLRTVLPDAAFPSWGPDGDHFVAVQLPPAPTPQDFQEAEAVIATVKSGIHDVIGPKGVCCTQWGGGAPKPDDDHDGIPDSLEQSLAEKWAPVIFMGPGEPNYPTNVDWFLQRATLKYADEGCFPDWTKTFASPVGSQQNLIGPPWRWPDSFNGDSPSFWQTCGIAPPLSTTEPYPKGNGPNVNGYDNEFGDEQKWYLDDLPEDQRVGSLNPSDWTTYFHAYPTADGGIMIQYWHFFAYNQLSLDTHGGDWDAVIQVQLSSGLQLEGIWFSRHTDDAPGSFIVPDDLTFFDGTHPQVAIDEGGHAAYASPEDWCIDPHIAPVNVHVDTIVWTGDPTDPSSLQKVQDCALGATFGPQNLSEPVGGTVWETWPGGTVRQGTPPGKPGPDHSISPNPGTPGPMVNLGEYNPGAGQVSSLGGPNDILNGQDFVKFSGRWGHSGILAGGWPGPVFQGWVQDKAQFVSWYNQAAQGPWKGQLRLPAQSASSIGRVIFVHGINSDCSVPRVIGGANSLGLTQFRNPVHQIGFLGLLDPLRAEIGADNVLTFCYQDDLAFGRPNCTLSPVDANVGPLYVEPGSADPASRKCDGNGALAYDSTKLEAQLKAMYQQDIRTRGSPVNTAIIANSMGAAVTRGWMELASSSNSPTVSMVSTVVFLQGAQEGSVVALAGEKLLELEHSGNLLVQLPAAMLHAVVGAAIHLDPSRPGVKDLAPGSSWYRSINRPGAIPPSLHYFNFYANIRLHLTGSNGDQGPVTLDLGDMIMPPGVDDPTRSAPLGGSRFLPFGSAPDQHEYLLQRDYSADQSLNDTLGLALTINQLYNSSEVSHQNFGHNIASLHVDSCAGGQVTVADEILRILRDPANACAAGT